MFLRKVGEVVEFLMELDMEEVGDVVEVLMEVNMEEVVEVEKVEVGKGRISSHRP